MTVGWRMQTTKSLRGYKRNLKDREPMAKPTSVQLSKAHKDFLDENELSLAAIVREKIQEIIDRTEREKRKIEKNNDDL